MNNNTQLTIAASIIAVGLVVAALLFTLGGGGFQSTKKFNVVMENNRYTPSEINVPVGSKVVINFENRDAISHALEIPEFNATLPGGHVPANGTAKMEFIADRVIATDAAVCGGVNPTDKTDDHGEEFIVRVI